MSLPRELLDRHDCVFAWGASDCVQWVADGIDVIAGWRPELPAYGSEAEAREILAAHGGLEAMVSAVLGDPIPVVAAGLGDVVVTAFRGTGAVLGIADPPVFWLRGDRAIMPVPLDKAVRVYPCRRPRSRS